MVYDTDMKYEYLLGFIHFHFDYSFNIGTYSKHFLPRKRLTFNNEEAVLPNDGIVTKHTSYIDTYYI